MRQTQAHADRIVYHSYINILSQGEGIIPPKDKAVRGQRRPGLRRLAHDIGSSFHIDQVYRGG